MQIILVFLLFLSSFLLSIYVIGSFSVPKGISTLNLTDKESLDRLLPKYLLKINKKETKFRLPDSVVPVFYNLSFFTNFSAFERNSDSIFYGNLTIEIDVISETNFFYLNCYYNIEIRSLEVLDNISWQDETENFTRVSSDEILVQTKSSLKVGRRYTIRIQNFISNYTFNSNNGWLVRSYVDSLSNTFQNVLSTQMQPESTRKVFPCFDEPKFKSNYKLKLTTNAEFNILFNMAEEKCILSPDKLWKTCEFKKSIKMPTYNFAIVICLLDNIQKIDSKGRIFRVWGRHSLINRAEYALNITVKVLEMYEKEFGIDFPLEKIDSVAIPNLDGFLGMEHYGLVTYDEPALLWSKDRPMSFSKELCTLIVSHEIAHQWFGNLVTNYWWQELWLNEGFTTFYSYKMTARLLKDPDYYSQEKYKLTTYVREMDDYFSIEKSTILFPVLQSAEMKFDYLPYKKGFLVVDMIEGLMGQTEFKTGIIDYLKTNSYKSVNTSAIWSSLNKYSKVDLNMYISDWLKFISYPTIRVKKTFGFQSENDSTLTFLQVKDSKNFNSSNELSKELWNAPVFIAYGDNFTASKSRLLLVNKTENVFDLRPFNSSQNWMFININLKSYMMVEYVDPLLSELVSQMKRNHRVIPYLSRAQFLMDNFYSSRKNKNTNIPQLLDLMTYIRYETEPIPLNQALTIIDKFHALFQYRNFYISWIKYLKFILDPLFLDLVKDFEQNFPVTSSTRTNLRRNLLYTACKMKLDICDVISSGITERWRRGYLFPGDYDLLHLALCQWISRDTTGEYWLEVHNSTDFTSWDYINAKYYAIGCSNLPWVIDKTIGMIYRIGSVNMYRYNWTSYPHIFYNEFEMEVSDSLDGVTRLDTITMMSFCINNPAMMNTVQRLEMVIMEPFYYTLVNRPHFHISESLLEYMMPSLSHYNFNLRLMPPKLRPTILMYQYAKTSVDWVVVNVDIQKYLEQYDTLG